MYQIKTKKRNKSNLKVNNKLNKKTKKQFIAIQNNKNISIHKIYVIGKNLLKIKTKP